jgi:DNA-directed RNA polymerase specialized sigma24 family protein
MVNRYTDWWHRRIRRERAHPPDPYQPVRGELADQLARRTTVLCALSRLTGRERVVVVLRYHVGLTEAEIARELGWPVGTVISTAAHAVATLRADPGLRTEVTS